MRTGAKGARVRLAGLAGCEREALEPVAGARVLVVEAAARALPARATAAARGGRCGGTEHDLPRVVVAAERVGRCTSGVAQILARGRRPALEHPLRALALPALRQAEPGGERRGAAAAHGGVVLEAAQRRIALAARRA